MKEDIRKRHPTWHSAGSITADIGGELSSQCSLCGHNLHRLIHIPVLPQELSISLSEISLATCLSCLGWEENSGILYYSHDQNGQPICRKQGTRIISPEFKAEPLMVTTTKLQATSKRWIYQDWAYSNGRENLNRIGGPPTWIQNAEYPKCCDCSDTMSFIAQLDSYMTTKNGNEWLWGSGGICYIFWCDNCALSATTWQCT